jgi:cell wall-associated NlpC family hydrolase
MTAGYRYTWKQGGTTANVQDCSSYTQAVFNHLGINIGRNTEAQWVSAPGKKVSKDQLQKGDLVFFKNTYNSGYKDGVSHVGIYLGDGKFINNSSSKGRVVVTDLNSDYWGSRWLGGKRITT